MIAIITLRIASAGIWISLLKFEGLSLKMDEIKVEFKWLSLTKERSKEGNHGTKETILGTGNKSDLSQKGLRPVQWQ